MVLLAFNDILTSSSKATYSTVKLTKRKTFRFAPAYLQHTEKKKKNTNIFVRTSTATEYREKKYIEKETSTFAYVSLTRDANVIKTARVKLTKNISMVRIMYHNIENRYTV